MNTRIRISRAVDHAFPGEGMSLWHSVGPAAFQEIPHLHLHVHPRKAGDGLLRIYPGVAVDADPCDRAVYAARVRRAVSEL